MESFTRRVDADPMCKLRDDPESDLCSRHRARATSTLSRWSAKNPHVWAFSSLLLVRIRLLLGYRATNK